MITSQTIVWSNGYDKSAAKTLRLETTLTTKEKHQQTMVYSNLKTINQEAFQFTQVLLCMGNADGPSASENDDDDSDGDENETPRPKATLESVVADLSSGQRHNIVAVVGAGISTSAVRVLLFVRKPSLTYNATPTNVMWIWVVH